MATLILTAVGTAIGGPIGGSIGAMIGQQVDAQIFAPKQRHGPRLGDLSVQTSSYGTPIPKIFGKMRVAGTVIWATDLQEQRATSGGKGRPGTVQYSYSASFAVALSGRPIRDVRRIWADGKLLRGAAGDFKSETRFRLYLGDEEQEVDPLIAAAEGAGQAPAFRGMAYAVFEDFQLTDYGNRIPSLSFEVEADAGPVAIGEIAAMLSDGALVAGATPALTGFAAAGDSIRGAIEALAAVVPLSLRDDGTSLALAAGPGPSTGIGADEAGAEGPGADGRSEFEQRSADSVAGEVAVSYHDAGRDYQTGLQRATDGRPGGKVERLALPAVLGAGRAKAIAEGRLAALQAGRATAKLHLGCRRAAVRPGDHVRIEGRSGLWKVERWTLSAMVASLELVRVQSGQVPENSDASAGRPIGHPDLLHGPTTLRLMDIPAIAEEPVGRPQLFAAAAGVEPGWRRAALMMSRDGGSSWQEAGPTAAPAVIGTALTRLGPGGSALFDERNSVEVQLLNDRMSLESRDETALLTGAGLALLGEELIQFGTAEPLGSGRYRLSRLLRGRRGTEWAAAGHEAGDAFVLVGPRCLTPIDVGAAYLGAELQVMAVGLGDEEPGAERRLVTGEAIRPPSCVHLRAAREPNGDIRLRWTRRSRVGWIWAGGGEVPLGEEDEAYRLTLSVHGRERMSRFRSRNISTQ